MKRGLNYYWLGLLFKYVLLATKITTIRRFANAIAIGKSAVVSVNVVRAKILTTYLIVLITYRATVS